MKKEQIEKMKAGRNKNKKVDPQKELKKEFRLRYNYHRGLILAHKFAVKEFKAAMKELKAGKVTKAKQVMAKFEAMDFNKFMAYLEVEKQKKKNSKKKDTKKKGKK